MDSAYSNDIDNPGRAYVIVGVNTVENPISAPTTIPVHRGCENRLSSETGSETPIKNRRKEMTESICKQIPNK